ncbi:hypothetical protein [Hungatella hathewayi]|uniref:hypothetical protein n=1 Tax=Hungatella hathewayi TaxID=154046 RepID=UPI0006C6F6BA|nr:hypothetical protein [Hungatella hathewayi]CUQ46174.1 Uncharacterised protein [Hungatella hathewayi]
MISLLTDDMDHCFFCGRPADCEHHLIFGSANRELADEDCLKVPICNNCHTEGKVNSRIHDNPMAEKLSKMLGQMAYEKELALKMVPMGRELFRARYGKSYL